MKCTCCRRGITMSTTDPTSGGGAVPLPSSAQGHGLAGGDDHNGATGVNPASVAAGHEPDQFYVKPIMSIPLAVVATFVIAFTVAAGAFVYFRGEARQADPFAHP